MDIVSAGGAQRARRCAPCQRFGGVAKGARKLSSILMWYMTVLLLIGEGWGYDSNDTLPGQMEKQWEAVLTLGLIAFLSSLEMLIPEQKSERAWVNGLRYAVKEAKNTLVYGAWLTDSVGSQINNLVNGWSLNYGESALDRSMRVSMLLGPGLLAGVGFTWIDGWWQKRHGYIGDSQHPMSPAGHFAYGGMLGATVASNTFGIIKSLGASIPLKVVGMVSLPTTAVGAVVHMAWKGPKADKALGWLKDVCYLPWEVLMAIRLGIKAVGEQPFGAAYALKGPLMLVVGAGKFLYWHCQNSPQEPPRNNSLAVAFLSDVERRAYEGHVSSQSWASLAEETGQAPSGSLPKVDSELGLALELHEYLTA